MVHKSLVVTSIADYADTNSSYLPSNTLALEDVGIIQTPNGILILVHQVLAIGKLPNYAFLPLHLLCINITMEALIETAIVQLAMVETLL